MAGRAPPLAERVNGGRPCGKPRRSRRITPLSVPVTASNLLRAGAAWAAFTLAGAGLLGAVNHARLAAAFEAEARNLHRVVSQRADQHDALLTGLAALLATPDPAFQGARAVAEAVRRFYPRVVTVDILTVGAAPRVLLTAREQDSDEAGAARLATPARDLGLGRTALLTEPEAGRYTLLKRLGEIGPAGPGAAALGVDAGRLAEPETPLDPGTAFVLADPEGRPLHARPGAEGGVALIPAFAFERPLGSRSQPLVLGLSRRPGLAEVLPPASLLAVALLAAGGVGLALYVLAARRGAREAERQASLRGHEARLAHAMRVNAVGEMGSGIAHELTQPLTAILAQAQAGLRLARGSGEVPPGIVAVLEANARQARRAGDILGRLRAYVGGRTPEPCPTDLNALVRGVAELAGRDLEMRDVALALRLDDAAPLVAAVDPVSVEQVVHNLLRNAADALQAVPEARRTVTVSTRNEGGEAAIIVADRGPGIAPADLPRLFEPFFTTKPDGLGLGLPLCERLAEAFGGRIGAANREGGGAVFTLRLPLAATVPGPTSATATTLGAGPPLGAAR